MIFIDYMKMKYIKKLIVNNDLLTKNSIQIPKLINIIRSYNTAAKATHITQAELWEDNSEKGWRRDYNKPH